MNNEQLSMDNIGDINVLMEIMIGNKKYSLNALQILSKESILELNANIEDLEIYINDKLLFLGRLDYDEDLKQYVCIITKEIE